MRGDGGPRRSALLGAVVAWVVAGLLTTAHAGATPCRPTRRDRRRLTHGIGDLGSRRQQRDAPRQAPPRQSRPVVLERSVDGGWAPLAERTSSSRGKFRFTVRVAEGSPATGCRRPARGSAAGGTPLS